MEVSNQQRQALRSFLYYVFTTRKGILGVDTAEQMRKLIAENNLYTPHHYQGLKSGKGTRYLQETMRFIRERLNDDIIANFEPWALALFLEVYPDERGKIRHNILKNQDEPLANLYELSHLKSHIISNLWRENGKTEPSLYNLYRYATQSHMNGYKGREPQKPKIIQTAMEIFPAATKGVLPTFKCHCKTSYSTQPATSYAVEGHILPLGSFMYFIGVCPKPYGLFLLVMHERDEGGNFIGGLMMREHVSKGPFATRIGMVRQYDKTIEELVRDVDKADEESCNDASQEITDNLNVVGGVDEENDELNEKMNKMTDLLRNKVSHKGKSGLFMRFF